MRVLYIYGDGDYAASEFENMGYVSRLAEMYDAGEALPLPEGVYFRVFEFGEVDPEFVTFIRNNIQEYDESKHRNFYVF